MADKNWRKNLDLVVEENIRELIKESKIHDEAIRNSKNPSKAQIWVVMAMLNDKINSLTLEKKEYKKKIPKKELDKILKTLEKL